MREPSDPFAIQPWMSRSSMTEDIEGSTNIDSSLFDRIFNTTEFRAWSSGTKLWQLHCSGPPGCGKVPFYSLPYCTC